MINLLPPEQKQQYRAARANATLRGYLIIAVMMLLVLAVIFGGSFYINSVNQADYTRQLHSTEARLSDLREARTRTQDFNNNLKQAKTIFASQIKLSEVLAKISEKLPPGAVLSGLTLNTVELNKPLSLVAKVDTVEKAAVLKANFDASGYFTEVKIQNITGSNDPGTGAYPYNVNMLITLNKTITESSLAEGQQ